MACPEVISVSADNHAFMGDDPAEIFLAFTPFVYRYSFPDFNYIADVFAVNTFGLAAPWGSPGFMSDGECVVATPDGFYAIVVTSPSSSTQWGIIHITLDGLTATLIYDSGPIEAWTYGKLAWHPEDPDNLWVQLHLEDPGAVVANNQEYLYSINRTTGARTTRMDLKAESGGTVRPSNFGQIQQYATGIMFTSRVSSSIGDRVHVYDVASDTYDTIDATNIRGRYVLWDEQAVLWRTNGGTTHNQIDITSTSPVSLAVNPTPICELLRGYFSYPPDLGSFYFAHAQEWYAPIDRSVIYISDTANVWQMTLTLATRGKALAGPNAQRAHVKLSKRSGI
jgi:hypothetical protein